MATPQVATDGNNMDAATFNKYVAAGGGKQTVKVVYARIQYTGSAWQVVSTVDSAEITSANVAWSTDHINIAISGFTVIPAVFVSPTLADATIMPKAIGASTTQLQVAFYSAITTRVTVQATSMDVYILAIGV